MTTHELIAGHEEKEWSVEDASSLYMLDRWGAGYFDVSQGGDVTVAPLQTKGIALPIIDVVREAQ